MSLLKTITNIFNNKEKHSVRYIEYTPSGRVRSKEEKGGNIRLVDHHINTLENGEKTPVYVFEQDTKETTQTMKTLTKEPRRVVRVNFENDLYGYRYQTVTES